MTRNKVTATMTTATVKNIPPIVPPINGPRVLMVGPEGIPTKKRIIVKL